METCGRSRVEVNQPVSRNREKSRIGGGGQEGLFCEFPKTNKRQLYAANKCYELCFTHRTDDSLL